MTIEKLKIMKDSPNNWQKIREYFRENEQEILKIILPKYRRKWKISGIGYKEIWFEDIKDGKKLHCKYSFLAKRIRLNWPFSKADTLVYENFIEVIE